MGGGVGNGGRDPDLTRLDTSQNVEVLGVEGRPSDSGVDLLGISEQ